jgi:hypothetical protein
LLGPTVVLDATELRRDWMLSGFRMQLLGTRALTGSLSVKVPPSALEEIVAHQMRESESARQAHAAGIHALKRLGHFVPDTVIRTQEYRAYLLECFDEVLGFEVLDWPRISHEELVYRAVNRKPPFDSKGGGYRDSLVWANVRELAAEGSEVVLISADRGFEGSRGELHPALQAEIEGLTGSVRLVQDLAAWLLSTLPEGESLLSAVQEARDEQFAEYYFQSDMQNDLYPSGADIGFSHRPIRFEVDASEWGGGIRKIFAAPVGEGSIVAEYDIDQLVNFRATLPEEATMQPSWEIESHVGDETSVVGCVNMVVRLAVLFEANGSFAIDELSWRRADGGPPGFDVAQPDPSNVPLF